jgi:glycosyltransferase involved in cell wall biosynthesis
VPATLLVATETHFDRTADGRVYSTTGVDGYGFWTRYLDVFDRVVVAARTRTGPVVEGAPRVEGPGVEVAALPDYRGPWEYVRTRTRLALAMRRAVSSVDALCLRAPGPIAGLAWRLRGGRPYGVEVVGDPSDALGPGTVRSATRPLARVALARELRTMCRTADAVSYVTAGILQRRYPARGWSTWYSSIELDDEAFVREDDVRRRYHLVQLATRGMSTDPWRFIFVGSLAQRYKGLDVAIDALALCRSQGLNARMIVVGGGVERRGFEDLARARDVESAISFVGQVAPMDVRRMLDGSDVFVLPSRTEGLPRAMVEAMARGVVCVGTCVGGIPELLPRSRLVPPGDARSLARILAQLGADRGALASLALADRAMALRYRASVLRPRRIALYERVRSAVRYHRNDSVNGRYARDAS